MDFFNNKAQFYPIILVNYILKQLSLLPRESMPSAKYIPCLLTAGALSCAVSQPWPPDDDDDDDDDERAT